MFDVYFVCKCQEEASARKPDQQERRNRMNPALEQDMCELMVDKALGEIDEIMRAAWDVREQGIEIVLVSMGGKDILPVGEKEQYLASPPEVIVKNTIGVAHSAVAGFVCGLVEGKSLKEALICAVAAGTATTLRPGTAFCQKDDFLKLIAEITVHHLYGWKKEKNNMEQTALYVHCFEEITIEAVPLVGGKKASLRKTYRELTGQGFRILSGCAGLTA